MAKTAKAPDGFYSATEAIKKLGLPRSTFYDMVEKGTIPKVVPPHRRDGYYPKAVIDDMVRAQQVFIVQYATQPATFEKATRADVQGIYDVGVSLWGATGTPTIETRLNWYKSNPDIDYVVKQNGVVAGYISLMPLRHETIEQLLSGEKRGWEITPDELQPFTTATPLECFVMAIGVRAGLHKAEKYGMRLFSGAIQALGEMGKRGIIFDKFYATSNSPDGIKASLDLGFEELGITANTTRRKFVLDVATSSSLLLQDYKQEIHNALPKTSRTER